MGVCFPPPALWNGCDRWLGLHITANRVGHRSNGGNYKTGALGAAPPTNTFKKLRGDEYHVSTNHGSFPRHENSSWRSSILLANPDSCSRVSNT